MSNLGQSFFNNFGLLALIYIFTMEWLRGNQLDESKSIALMAMIFYLFMQINAMTYFGFTIA